MSAEALLEWARRQLGTVENPPNSNRVKYWDDIGMSGAQGQPWCAAFYLAGLLATSVKPTSRSVFVPRLVSDYRQAGTLMPVAEAEPGDQVLYHFGQGHTGIVESIDPSRRMVTAIEGNTSAGTTGSQHNGGGVHRRTRPWSQVTGCGRPAFPGTSLGDRRPTAITVGEEEVEVAMIVIDNGGANNMGRDAHWEFDKMGNAFNWNGARPLKSLREIDEHANLPIIGVVPDLTGDGVVLLSADARQDDRGHWVRSTYRILVGM